MTASLTTPTPASIRLGFSTFYADADDDTYGDLNTTDSSCDPADGFVADSTDCNDTVAAINPGATEVCDDADVDEDCDGDSDDADTNVDVTTYTTFYADSDGDTFGDLKHHRRKL